MQVPLKISPSHIVTTYYRYDFNRVTAVGFSYLWLHKFGDFDPFYYEYE